MSDKRHCEQCGAELSPLAPQGLCPGCLLKRGLDSQATANGPDAAPTAPTPAAEYAPPAPAELAAHFPDLEVLEFVGRGGMGMVYKARQKRLDRIVALKILLPQIGRKATFAERFVREARALAMLNHPAIVAVYDFGEADGLFYFVMEFVDGVNLRRMLETGELSSPQALAIVPQICDALQFAHTAGVVHRDIKPENILLDRSGRVKIADFGLAKLVGPDVQAHTLTGTGQVMGTPHYMAPEQFEHPQSVDHRADIYSLGVVFYQMLTGELPLGRFAPPSRKVHIDVRLDEVVLHALEKEPDHRYQHASEVKSEVEAIVHAQAADHAAEPKEPKAGAAQVRADVPAGRSSQARLSRSAVVGAAWSPFCFVMLLLSLVIIEVRVPVSESGEGLGQVPGPAWWQVLLSLILLPLGLTAPFGTTILGMVALSQIRHSAGKLYGLGLALADALLFPLLLLDGLIAWGWIVVIQAIASTQPGVKSPELELALSVILILVTCAVVDGLIIVRAWHAVTDRTRPPAADIPRADDERLRSALQQVRAPSVGLIVTSVLNWLTIFAVLPFLLPAASRQEVPLVLFLLLVAILAVSSGFILIGALKMQHLESRFLACLASLLAILIGPGYILGWPMGLWSLVVLTRPEVREAFRLRAGRL